MPAIRSAGSTASAGLGSTASAGAPPPGASTDVQDACGAGATAELARS